MLLHTGAFTHRPFYTQALLHTDPFTHRPFFTQTLLHTNAFTHTDAFTHEPFYTQLLLHTEAFTHRRFYTQTLLHTDPFIHKRFYTQTLYTQMLAHTIEIAILPQFLTLEPRFVREGFIRHTWNRNFPSVFDTRTSFCAWRVHPAHLKSQFSLSFWHSNLVLCVKGSSGTLEIAILPQFLTLEPRFVREGFIRHAWNRNFTSVFDTRTSFRAWRVHPDNLKSQFYLSFWHSNLVSCERVDVSTRHACKSQFYLSFWHSNLVLCVKGSSGTLEIAIFPQFLTLEPRFVREGFIRTTWNRNFTSVFDTRTSFCAWRVHPAHLKSQFYRSFWHSNLVSCERVDVSWSVVGTARGLKRERRRRREWKGRERQRGEREREREREEREREREREKRERMWGCEDVKMWRCEDVKMWRCEDVKMWRCGCEDVKMCRCEDMRMWRCEDVKMWGCEDVKMWWCEDVKMWRCEDVKLWRCEDVMMWRCESMQIQLLEEPFAQTLSGKKKKPIFFDFRINQSIQFPCRTHEIGLPKSGDPKNQRTMESTLWTSFVLFICFLKGIN